MQHIVAGENWEEYDLVFPNLFGWPGKLTNLIWIWGSARADPHIYVRPRQDSNPQPTDPKNFKGNSASRIRLFSPIARTKNGLFEVD